VAVAAGVAIRPQHQHQRLFHARSTPFLSIVSLAAFAISVGNSATVCNQAVVISQHNFIATVCARIVATSLN